MYYIYEDMYISVYITLQKRVKHNYFLFINDLTPD